MRGDALQQRAVDYVTEGLPPAERAAFAAELTRNAALAEEVSALERTYAQLAWLAPAAELPPGLRERTLETAVTPPVREWAKAFPASPAPPSGTRWVSFAPWLLGGIAASIGLLLWLNLGARQERLATSGRKLQTAEASLQRLERKMAGMEDAVVRGRARVAEVEADLGRLRTENGRLSIALSEAERRAPLDRLEIIPLSSEFDTAYEASVAWDAEKRVGVLQIARLPASPPATEYKVWVIDAATGRPTGAGTFPLDASGRARVPFQPVGDVGAAQIFAVSLEKTEDLGNSTPKGPIVLSSRTAG